MTYICLNDNFESYLVIDIYLENDQKVERFTPL